MPYDGVFAAAIVRELNETVVGARIDKIFQPAPDTLLLHCRKPGETYQLLISAHPRRPRMHLTKARIPNPLHPPVFCMTLRKHLDPGRIAAVEQQGLDRVVHIIVDGFDDVGRPARRLLIAELTGRHGNVVLVDGATGRIIDALKRANRRMNAHRALLPGEAYVPPPAGNKVDPRALTAGQTAEHLLAAFDEGDGKPSFRDVAGALTDRFHGLSPFAARELLLRGPEGKAPDPRQIAVRLHAFVEDVEQGRFAPAVRRNGDGTPADVWAFPPRQWEDDDVEPFARANDAADLVFTHAAEAERTEGKRRLLERGLRSARKRLVRKAEALTRDLEAAGRADEQRVFGELLTANMHLVQRGDAATVPNYYDEGKPVTIPLDPSLSPSANAQRYFKRYSKLKTAATVVQEQLDETNADIAWLDQAKVHVDMARTERDLDEIAQELAASGFLPRNVRAALQDEGPERSRRRRQKGRTPPAPPMEAVLADGVRALIGGNSRQNDRISLRLAKPDDLWFHAKDLAGAHVLVPRNQPVLAGLNEIPPRLIEEAAGLAAFFSAARRSTNVPVDWTLAKHVRKPRGARPGMVLYDGHRTVYVTPDEQTVLKQLARAQPTEGMQ